MAHEEKKIGRDGWKGRRSGGKMVEEEGEDRGIVLLFGEERCSQGLVKT